MIREALNEHPLVKPSPAPSTSEAWMAYADTWRCFECSTAYTELSIPYSAFGDEWDDTPVAYYDYYHHTVKDIRDAFDFTWKTWRGKRALARHFLCNTCRRDHEVSGNKLDCVHCWFSPIGLPPHALADLDPCRRCDKVFGIEQLKSSVQGMITARKVRAKLYRSH